MVKFSNQQVLFELPVVVSVPTSTVEKVQIVRYLDEANTTLHESTSQQQR